MLNVNLISNSFVWFPDTVNLLPSRTECGIQADDKIIGGMETGIREYPWMVLLGYQERNVFIL